jgi:hypothetical protein
MFGGLQQLCPAQSALVPADIEKQVRALCAMDKTFVLPTGFDIEFELRLHPFDPAVVDKWREEVSGKRDHPRNHTLRSAERRARNGDDVQRERILYWDDSLWRKVAETPHNGEQARYSDAGSNPHAVWAVDPNQLIMEDGGSDDSPQRREATRNHVRSSIIAFASQGLADVWFDAKDAMWNTTCNGNQFAIEVTSPSGLHAMIKGEVAADNTLYVTKFESFLPNDRNASSTCKLFNHRNINGLGVVADRTGHDGEHSYSASLQSYRTAKRQDIESAAATPDPTGSDPFRGKLTVSLVNDLRSEQVVVRERQGEDWIEGVVPRPSDSRSTLRTVGWFACGGLVFTIVMLRVLKR